jgi:hypothetical protein
MQESDATLPKGARRITRDEYVDLLTDSAMQEGDDMAEGFMVWCNKHVPVWRAAGRDEAWIRQRIESARATQSLHETLRQKGFSRAQRRAVFREMYQDMPAMYDLMMERERTEPHLSIIYGTPNDLMQRYTLRVMLYETEKANYERLCRWRDRTPEVESYTENESMRHIRDLSTVEELEFALALARYLGTLLEAPMRLTAAQIGRRMEQHGQLLRQRFIEKYGYPPEQSTTPRIAVTINGPIDPDADAEE